MSMPAALRLMCCNCFGSFVSLKLCDLAVFLCLVMGSSTASCWSTFACKRREVRIRILLNGILAIREMDNSPMLSTPSLRPHSATGTNAPVPQRSSRPASGRILNPGAARYQSFIPLSACRQTSRAALWWTCLLRSATNFTTEAQRTQRLHREEHVKGLLPLTTANGPYGPPRHHAKLRLALFV